MGGIDISNREVLTEEDVAPKVTNKDEDSQDKWLEINIMNMPILEAAKVENMIKTYNSQLLDSDESLSSNKSIQAKKLKYNTNNKKTKETSDNN